MLQTRSQSAHVHALKSVLEGVENNAIGAVADSVDILRMVLSTKIQNSSTMATYDLPPIT